MWGDEATRKGKDLRQVLATAAVAFSVGRNQNRAESEEDRAHQERESGKQNPSR